MRPRNLAGWTGTIVLAAVVCAHCGDGSTAPPPVAGAPRDDAEVPESRPHAGRAARASTTEPREEEIRRLVDAWADANDDAATLAGLAAIAARGADAAAVLVAWLASDDAGFMTGSVLTINDGQYIANG